MSPLSHLAPQSRIPSPFELAELLDRVLSDWAFLSATPAGKPAEGPAPLDLEYTVRLSGPLDVLMVLRGSHAFAAELAEASTGDPGAREQATDAFKELCNLLASHLLTAFFGGTDALYAPFVPEPSLPAQWPSGPASTETVILVDRFPVEARLWVSAAGAGRG